MISAIYCVTLRGELKHACTSQLIQSKLLETAGCMHWNEQKGSRCFRCACSQAVEMRSWQISSASWWHPIDSLGAGFRAKFWRISFQQSFYPQKKEKPEVPLSRSLLLLLIWEALKCNGQIWIYHPDWWWKVVFKSLIHHHWEVGIYSEEVLTRSGPTESAEWHIGGNTIYKWCTWRGGFLAQVFPLAVLILFQITDMGRCVRNPQWQCFYSCFVPSILAT